MIWNLFIGGPVQSYSHAIVCASSELFYLTDPPSSHGHSEWLCYSEPLGTQDFLCIVTVTSTCRQTVELCEQYWTAFTAVSFFVSVKQESIRKKKIESKNNSELAAVGGKTVAGNVICGIKYELIWKCSVAKQVQRVSDWRLLDTFHSLEITTSELPNQPMTSFGLSKSTSKR